MPVKQRQQARQEQRLSQNIQAAKQNKKELRKTPGSKDKKPSGGVSSSMTQRLFGVKTPPQTAQQSIPYREMHRDGICRTNAGLFNKTIAFGDTNYQLAQNEDKTQIFDGWCDFLNYFDSTISVQLSFINQYGNLTDFEKSIQIPENNDDFNSIRREYADMLKNQLAKGNNGLVKKKYITFGIEAASLRDAKPRLERIEADVIAGFKALGVGAQALSGQERLELLHGQFHPDGKEKLRFNWKDLPKTGLSTKDYIAPTSFDFRDGKTFRMGTSYGAVSFISIIAPELTDRMLADFLDMDNAITLNLHIKSIDQSEAIKTIKRKITDLDAMKIAEVRPDRALCEVA